MSLKKFKKTSKELADNYNMILQDLIATALLSDMNVSFTGNYTQATLEDPKATIKIPFIIYQSQDQINYLKEGILAGNILEPKPHDTSCISGKISKESIKFDKKYNIKKINPKTIKYNGISKKRDGAYEGTWKFEHYTDKADMTNQGIFGLSTYDINQMLHQIFQPAS